MAILYILETKRKPGRNRMTRHDLIQELKDFAIVNNNNLVMMAAEELEAQAAELNAKRTGRVLLDLENERALSDLLVSKLSNVFSGNTLSDQEIFDAVKKWADLRAGNSVTDSDDSSTCDVASCNQTAVECHGGEINFCQGHYEGAAAAQKAGIPVEKAFEYK
jgi:hypothetical protein